MAKLMTAKCSRCGKGFRAETKGDLLNRIRTHMWKEHEDWMRRRVKAGLRKAKKAQSEPHMPGNPFLETLKKVLNPSWTGFAERPIIEKLTGRPYEQVRAEVLDAFVAQLFDGIKKL